MKELFLELKREDEQHAPGFGLLWATACARRSRPRWRKYLTAVAAAAALTILGILAGQLIDFRDRVHPSRTLISGAPPQPAELPWQSALLISQWQAPTDFLLDLPIEPRLEGQAPSDNSEKN